MSEKRICAKCKHFGTVTVGGSPSPWWALLSYVTMEFNVCKVSLNLVTGYPIECERARFKGGECGPEGILWVAKEPHA